jgi:hypothetical protein|tara:strand:- start:237 stop:443 length:207 start_codon:yes stop_codon:yes gene_type:complete
MPTGMTLSSSGLVSWDVRDSVLCSGCSQNDVNDVDDLWVAVIMVEDRHDNGTANFDSRYTGTVCNKQG